MDITIKCQTGESRVHFGPIQELSTTVDLHNAVVVSDAELCRLHGGVFPDCPVIEVERGEAAKSLASLEMLYERFLELELGRDATILAIGGGSITDLAGFSAATWLRGVSLSSVPTTLLAMVDASIGGKNGIDFRGRKNLLGTIVQPRLVHCDVSFLSTLPDEQFASGMAEVIKTAVLSGKEYFGFLEMLGGKRTNLDHERLERLVSLSVEYKAAVVGRDERETGERRKLNLGHTIGHALELTLGIPHGHAVATGLALSCRLAVHRKGLSSELCERIIALLAAWGLPTSIEDAYLLSSSVPKGAHVRESVSVALGADKKRSGDDILFVLPEGIGSVSVQALSLSALRDFVQEAP